VHGAFLFSTVIVFTVYGLTHFFWKVCNQCKSAGELTWGRGYVRITLCGRVQIKCTIRWQLWPSTKWFE